LLQQRGPALIFRDPPAFLGEVEAVARLGAAELLHHWQRLAPGEIAEKAPNDLVSAADLASERAILAAIRERFPDHRILSEEAGASGVDATAPTWIVDPLDGTTNFVHGLPHFAVTVAVTVGGRVDFAVTYDPLRDELFSAARGRGAWRNRSRLACSARAGLAGAFLCTGFPFRSHRLIDPYLRVFRAVFLAGKAVRRTGSAALDLAWVAAGIFDGFFELGLGPWDLAAGSLLVAEAGGVVTGFDGAADYLGRGHVLCGTPGVHRELLATVAALDPPVVLP
jgi:myo-inositol-1(or 4)-monophosphatase